VGERGWLWGGARRRRSSLPPSPPAPPPPPAPAAPMVDPDGVAVVEFVPVRCPHCGRAKPRTDGVRGKIRYHTCRFCRRKFKSVER
jgi:hypothetical protein